MSERSNGGASTAPARRRPPTVNVNAAAQRLGVSESTIRRWIRSGRLNPSCLEVYAHVHAYLDHELSEEERAAVQRHLDACPGCDGHFRFDGTVLRWVQRQAPGSQSTEPAVGRILDGFRERVQGAAPGGS